MVADVKQLGFFCDMWGELSFFAIKVQQNKRKFFGGFYMKKRKLFRTFLFSMGVLPLAGCITLPQDDYESQMQFKRLQVKDQKHARQLQGLNQALAQQDALIRSLAEAMSENSMRVEKLEGQVLAMEKSMGRNTKALEQRLEAERRQREKSSQALLNQVSKEIATTASTLQNRQNKIIKAMSETSAEEYQVRSGDTLSVIAQAFGVSVNSIKRANNLSSDIIRVGQKLTIPSK